jgi:hypothetical protein
LIGYYFCVETWTCYADFHD